MVSSWRLILIQECSDLAVKLPKLNTVTDGQLLSLLNCLCVVRADQSKDVEELIIRVDQIDPVFRHGVSKPTAGWMAGN
jgi:hypothetical protein